MMPSLVAALFFMLVRSLVYFMKTAIVAAILLFIAVSNSYSTNAIGNNRFSVGQWIWSRADEKIFLESRKIIPNILPCIWISTITVSRGAIVQNLAISPELAKSVGSAAFIVRIDDSLNALWNKERPDKIAHDIDSCLKNLIKLLTDAGVNIEEMQLDYDCPVRRLSAWSLAVRIATKGSLKGKHIWITSLPVHINDADYSVLFRGIVTGHILQLFDTGISANQNTLDRLSLRLRRQSMPFRIGLGAFERAHSHESTDHQLWFSALSLFAEIPGYQGVWIFPGGGEWVNLYLAHSSN
ncbi:MAG: hypothetical protein A2X58_00665 [Nitrospirae bacterium GWC2_56_14]|nr:MAG: hypothetical protein A2X58_00665 [Nitrospirae bacterium GWC2_56_14]